MNHKNPLLIFILSSLVLIWGCKSHFSNNTPTEFGGSFPNKTTVVEDQIKPAQPASAEPAVRFEPNNANVKTPAVARSQKQKITLQKALAFKKTIRNLPLVDSTDTDQILEPIKPMEKNALIGFWLVIGSLIGGLIPFIQYFAFIGMLAGFILGIIGLVNIKKHPDDFRGKGKAIAAIVIPIVLTIIVIAALILFLALFAL